MNDRLFRGLYNFGIAYPLLAGYWSLGLFQDKAREYFRVRERLFVELLPARKKLPPEQKLILVHVASVGELLQANPVIAGLKEFQPAPLVALSFTSASVVRNFPKGVAADFVTPSPLDTTAQVEKFLDLLAPDLLLFSTYDLWPNLVLAGAERGLPMILINAALPENSGRLTFPARFFFQRIYSHLLGVGAITEADAQRMTRLGVEKERIMVTGNCRYDQTLARAQAVQDNDPDLTPIPQNGFVLVAGSTWPQDQERLLPALTSLLSRFPQLIAVIAPHEPSTHHLTQVENFFEKAGIRIARYSTLRDKQQVASERVVLVDVLGVLYKIYKRGQVAYVGGSFHQGVHSVMEPAGLGLPVVIGPVHENSAEAKALVQVGGAAVVRTTEQLESVVERWLKNEAERKTAGERARQLMLQNLGATQRTLQMLKKYWEGNGSVTSRG